MCAEYYQNVTIDGFVRLKGIGTSKSPKKALEMAWIAPTLLLVKGTRSEAACAANG